MEALEKKCPICKGEFACSECASTGIVLTDTGERLLSFIRRYLFEHNR